MPDTVYHVRAYAINQVGVAYGNEVTFRTLRDVTYGSVTDVVGNTYLTVKVGTQEWMAENLRTHNLNDATPIPWKMEDSAWAATASPAWSLTTGDLPMLRSMERIIIIMRCRRIKCALTDGAFPPTRIGKRWPATSADRMLQGESLRKSEPFAGQTQMRVQPMSMVFQEGVRE